jgi:hypothetical protein
MRSVSRPLLTRVTGAPHIRFRHAAALSLLVVAGCASSTGNTGSSGEWLLMVPPLTSGGNADTSAPLSRWQNIGNFANETDSKNKMTAQQFVVRK